MKTLSEVPEKPITLSRISEDPGPYCMSFGFELDPLVESIEKIGLIHAPCVVGGDGNSLDVVMGHRRILALKALKREQAPMKDFSPLGLKPLNLLLLNLYDNLLGRPFNDVEKGMILNRLKPYLSGENILKEYMPLLGLPSREKARTLYEKLEEMDPPLKASCAAGDLSMKSIHVLLEKDPESRKALFDWIKNMGFNFNQQLFFIEITEDISIHEEVSILQVLRDESITGIRDDENLNTPQKAKRVLAFLRSRRFPLLTHSEETFQKQVAHLDLPANVKISHPPFFEDPNYRLEISFENGRKLAETIGKLSRLTGLEGIGDPWEEKP